MKMSLKLFSLNIYFLSIEKRDKYRDATL